MRSRPPRVASALVSWLTPEADREEVMGDLEERFRARAVRDAAGAARWYTWQAVRSAPQLAWSRLVEPLRRTLGRKALRSGTDQRLWSADPRSRHRDFDGFGTEGWMASMWQDLSIAARTLSRTPGFTAVAILTLALGLGANTAVFTVFNGILLEPLPYAQPDRLVRLVTAYEQNPDSRNVLSGPDFVAWRDGTDAFEHLAVLYTYRERGVDLTDGDVPQRVRALPVSEGYFETYGTQPLLGRTFMRGEERSDARVALLSHHVWQTHAGGGPDVLGRTVTMDGESYTVIGVMPADFIDAVAGSVDVWIPHDLQPDYMFNGRGNTYLTGIGRLASGVTVAQAQAQLDQVSASLAEQFPDTNGQRYGRIHPLFDEVVGNARSLLYVLVGASALVLLIACVNVANLFLARGVARQRELAVRAALGAGRARLTRQLLAEGFVLALSGALLGTAVAVGGVRLLPLLGPASLPRAAEVGFRPSLVGFTIALTLLTGLVFGIVPSAWVSRSNLRDTLGDGSRGGSVGPAAGRARGVLVASQFALALMLLIGAGLLMRSFLELRQTPTGIDTDGVLAFEVHLPEARYGDSMDRIRFHQIFQQRLTQLPGVRSLGASSWLPLSGRYHSWGIAWRGADDELERLSAQVRVVEGDYFETLGIELTGRQFLPSDDSTSARVAVLSRSGAEAAYPGQDALGLEIGAAGHWRTIVGIAEDVAVDRRGSFLPTIYLPHSEYGHDRNWAMTQVVALEPGAPEAVPLIRRELAAVDPALVVYKPRWMTEVAGHQVARDRFALMLMGVFAGIALTLAAVGVYGVLSYSVGRRTQEIGIRMALGARASHVRRSVLGSAMRLATVGIGLGLAGAWLLSRFLESLLFGVGTRDPAVYAAVPLLLAAVALLAGYVPARRATNVDPVRALHTDGG